MKIAINNDSPIPIYHQIAEALRYSIATGRLSPGESLPPIREAATSFGVNLHTVRRAYNELAKENLIEIRGALGTRVVESIPAHHTRTNNNGIDSLVERVIRDAHDQFNLSPGELAHYIMNWSPKSQEASDVVYVVECSESQSADHAEEISSYWHVNAVPWSLSQKEEPPPGPVVATYFHYNEIRLRWPHRLHEINFAAIQPDPKLLPRLTGSTTKKKKTAITLCEFDESKAQNIAADLSVIFPEDRFKIVPKVVKRANELLSNSKISGPILFAPRVWDVLSVEDQQHPQAIKIQYVFSVEQMDSIGKHFEWKKRRHTKTREELYLS